MTGGMVMALAWVAVFVVAGGGIFLIVARVKDWISETNTKSAGHALGILLYGAVSYLILRGIVPETGALAGAFGGMVVLAMLSYLLWGDTGAAGRTALTSIVYLAGVAIALLGFTGALGAAAYQTTAGKTVVDAVVEFHDAAAAEIDRKLNP